MNDNSFMPCVILCFCFFVGGLLLGFRVGEFSTKEFKKHAIKSNFAHWAVDEEGNIKFEWNSPIEKETK